MSVRKTKNQIRLGISSAQSVLNLHSCSMVYLRAKLSSCKDRSNCADACDACDIHLVFSCQGSFNDGISTKISLVCFDEW